MQKLISFFSQYYYTLSLSDFSTDSTRSYLDFPQFGHSFLLVDTDKKKKTGAPSARGKRKREARESPGEIRRTFRKSRSYLQKKNFHCFQYDYTTTTQY